MKTRKLTPRNLFALLYRRCHVCDTIRLLDEEIRREKAALDHVVAKLGCRDD